MLLTRLACIRRLRISMNFRGADHSKPDSPLAMDFIA